MFHLNIHLDHLHDSSGNNKKAAQVKCLTEMKWHPLMIKWAVYLHYRSGGAYDTLRSSGVLALPSQRYFTRHFKGKVDEQVKAHADTLGVEDWQRYVILLLDEMHVREDIVTKSMMAPLLGLQTLNKTII